MNNTRFSNAVSPCIEHWCHVMQSMGVSVEQTPTSQLQSTVDRLVSEQGHVFCHPFDDISLIAAYGT